MEDAALTKADAENMLKLIDRALRASPVQGGLNDLKAIMVLVAKLQRMIEQE